MPPTRQLRSSRASLASLRSLPPPPVSTNCTTSINSSDNDTRSHSCNAINGLSTCSANLLSAFQQFEVVFALSMSTAATPSTNGHEADEKSNLDTVTKSQNDPAELRKRLNDVTDLAELCKQLPIERIRRLPSASSHNNNNYSNNTSAVPDVKTPSGETDDSRKQGNRFEEIIRRLKSQIDANTALTVGMPNSLTSGKTKRELNHEEDETWDSASRMRRRFDLAALRTAEAQLAGELDTYEARLNDELDKRKKYRVSIYMSYLDVVS